MGVPYMGVGWPAMIVVVVFFQMKRMSLSNHFWAIQKCSRQPDSCHTSLDLLQIQCELALGSKHESIWSNEIATSHEFEAPQR